jgi:mycothiol synthase
MRTLPFFPPRPYQDESDLESMEQVLEAGAQAGTSTHYVHIGDLRWWLFYGPPVIDLRQTAALWDDPSNPGRSLGWMLINPGWPSFDVFVQPDLLGSSLWSDMFTWAEKEALAACARVDPASQFESLHKLWVSNSDIYQITYLERRGYKPINWDHSFLANLPDTAPTVLLPEGFSLRLCQGVCEVASRAEAQYKAFGNTMPLETYQERFRNFMCTESYAGALDVVAVTADGRIASFCIAWLDPVTKEGHFEPVGTAPEFQKLGLGKAVLYEAMRRLRTKGMEQVSVVTLEENLPACALYKSVGFKSIGKLGLFDLALEKLP